MFSPEIVRGLAILLAVIGAVFLSLGAQFQNDAVTKHHSPNQPRLGALKVGQILDLLRRPRWLTGTSFLVLAVMFQLGALALAPLIVVQPIGAIALIMTSILNARIYRLKLNAKTFLAIGLTTSGVAGFVAFAASSAVAVELSNQKLLQVVGVLFLLLIMFGALFWRSKGKVSALQFIFGAGVLYGFVASLAKVVIQRILQQDFDLLTLLALASLLGATFLGGWFVQNAYASGPPDLVIAGLTVIDPAVAIGIAIVILGEANEASVVQMVGFVIAGITAAAGVFTLNRNHPQLTDEDISERSD
ncbi:MAG: DMT family transporter [Aquiluna sp.]|nr:DMT family transporter [Aquiluna sp.]